MPADNPLYHIEALEYADEFYRAYQQLQPSRNITTSWPRYLLLCQAVELGLKAFLVRCGLKERELRQTKIRHSIDGLMSEPLARGLSIGSHAESEIRLLAEAHENHWSRYPRSPQDRTKPIFVIEEFEPYVQELLQVVSKLIRGS